MASNNEMDNDEYRDYLLNERAGEDAFDSTSDALYRAPAASAGICGNLTVLNLGIFFAAVLLFLLVIFFLAPMITNASKSAPGECIQCPPGGPGPTGGTG